MKANAWRNAKYVSQIDRKVIASYYRKPKPSTIQCEKYICENKQSGELLSGITFTNGVTLIGPDVWRLSQRNDCCDYPFTKFDTIDEAKKVFNFREAPKCTYLKERRLEDAI